MTRRRKAEPAAAEWVDPQKLQPWRRNPRRLTEEDVLRVMSSIERFGFGAPLVARRRDNAIVAGHARREAAIRLGLARVPVRYLERDLDDRELEALLVADNRIGELRAWDAEQLFDVLAEVDPEVVALLEYDSAELNRLVAEARAPTPADAAIPASEETTGSTTEASGEVYELGEHRLLHGDAFDQVAVARLLDGEAPACVLFDPPYDLDVSGLPIEELGAATVVEFGRGKQRAYVHMRLVEAGYRPFEVVFDLRRSVALNEKTLPFTHHDVVYVFRKKGFFHDREVLLRYGYATVPDGRIRSIQRVTRPSKRHHKQAKSVEEVALACAHTPPGGVVLDLFAGAGSGLVAAERTGRRWRGVEIDRANVALIRRRYAALLESSAG